MDKAIVIKATINARFSSLMTTYRLRVSDFTLEERRGACAALNFCNTDASEHVLDAVTLRKVYY